MPITFRANWVPSRMAWSSSSVVASSFRSSSTQVLCALTRNCSRCSKATTKGNPHSCAQQHNVLSTPPISKRPQVPCNPRLLHAQQNTDLYSAFSSDHCKITLLQAKLCLSLHVITLLTIKLIKNWDMCGYPLTNTFFYKKKCHKYFRNPHYPKGQKLKTIRILQFPVN